MIHWMVYVDVRCHWNYINACVIKHSNQTFGKLSIIGCIIYTMIFFSFPVKDFMYYLLESVLFAG